MATRSASRPRRPPRHAPSPPPPAAANGKAAVAAASKPASPVHLSVGEDGEEAAPDEGAHPPGGHRRVGGVSEACRRMAAKRVDAALLTDANGMLSGILTAEDIAGRVIAEGLKPEETSVVKVMTRNPVFVMSNSSAIEALQKMVQGKFRHLPVVERGEVIAMLDITKFLYDAVSRMEMAAEQGSVIASAMEGVERQWGDDFPSFMESLREQMFKPSLSTIITENSSVPVVSPTDPVILAAKKMREHRVNSLVVMTGNMLLGTFTSKDLVLRVVAQNLPPEITLVEKVEGASGANDVANSMVQKFWDSALAMHPAEESDARSDESRMVASESADGKHVHPLILLILTVHSVLKLRITKGVCTDLVVVISESLDELVSAVVYRLGMDNEKSNLKLLYDDDEGDRVVLTTNGDLTAAIEHAKSAGWKVLRLHMDEAEARTESAVSLADALTSHRGRPAVWFGIVAGAVALTGVAVIVYLKRSQL
ncbi:unnamed protein product [Urochloa decumbens]|uniref:Uncharacterized protein n=1 Tax=Urochloa decumbens TaxID=240449 RepID=A0ABC9GZJ1_9POAL